MYRDISKNICKAEVLRNVLLFITQRYINQWTADIRRENARTGNGGINFDFIEFLSRFY